MKAINPHTGSLIKEFKSLTKDELDKKIQLSFETFQRLKTLDIESRRKKLKKLAEVIEERAEKIGETITKEMGKSITESISEAKKAAGHAKYLYENLEDIVAPDPIKTESKKSYIEFLPLGPIFVITPFNFPFWLAIKAGLPALAMGNTVLNKNASQCPMTGLCLEQCFRDAGYEEGEYQSLIVGKEATEQILSNFHVRGVSFTGSTDGGSQVAELAGKYIKKSVMELGGCDPCVVFKDADLKKAVDVVTESRLRNDGQVCSAIKRVIVDETIYSEFKNKLIERLQQVKIGDPMNKENKIGPLGSERIYKRILEQLDQGVKEGAKILYGGKRPEINECQKGYYISPTVVECTSENILGKEEVFGPVFSLLTFRDEKEALKIANSTRYGLGGVIISDDRDKAEKFGRLMECGMLSINENLKSDSRMPGGGVKDSGYGRDCGKEGAREFTNVKSVRIN